jgi:hypothetical protein
MNREPKRVWRLPPCPACDVAGTESWLAAMAAQGKFLERDGFFAGVAVFECRAPRSMRYRLTVKERDTGFLDDDGPPEAAVALHEDFGWQYVARRGDFYIYATEDPTATEPDTDPAVQAMALDLVRKRCRGRLLQCLFWVVLYPLVMAHWGLTYLLVEMGLGRALWLLALLVWTVGSGIAELLALRKVSRQLRAGQPMEHRKDWRRGTAAHWAGLALTVVLIAGVVWSLGSWRLADTDSQRVSLDDYGEPLPFATLADLGTDFQDNDLLDYNTVAVSGNLLAPTVLKVNVSGSCTMADGRQISGGMRVVYYETASPALARALARDLRRTDRSNNRKTFADLALPDLNVDDAAAYAALFPTVVLVQGKTVLHCVFYQTGPDQLTLAEWATALADSLQ